MPGDTFETAGTAPGRLPATLGFMCVAGPMLGAVVALWLQPLPRTLA